MEGIILSSWDHIMGPQIQKFWIINDFGNSEPSQVSCNILREFNITKRNKDVCNTEANLPDMETYSIMCGQLLLSEVDSCKPYDEWASRLYISEYKIIAAVVFHVNSWLNCTNEVEDAKDTCLCFGVIFKNKCLDFVLSNYVFIDQHLRKTVDIMQNSKIPFNSKMKDVEISVTNICLEINALAEQNVYCSQKMKYPIFQGYTNSELILKALASHLQTSGCTIVMGSSEFCVSQVLQALSLFNHQKQSSHAIPQVSSKTYIKGIFIRDSNKDAIKGSAFFLEKAFKESFSLSVVDTDLNKVWQTISVQDSNHMVRFTPSLVNENGFLIPQFLNDLAFIQQNEGDCNLFIENFNTFLMAKAASFIKIVENFRYCKGILTEDEIMTMFAVHHAADLQILLGCAEILKPGFRTTYVNSL
ncbi:uncharacterized protein CDAR_592741 [Caerostris darwini]|uniref:Uncharacterized protein n=1 Tax=Caerostris darwini TaxID=1538125 RepID=A0AAV4S1V8_9ARAC|nr:uncharacterized protein CDAR_592741 [Caerostris darwini]